MRYERDFTIGLRETQAFHVLLTLERWWKGLLGFGAAGALAAYLYIGMLFSDLILPGQIAIIAAAAVVTALLVALGMVLSTRRRVRVQLRRSPGIALLEGVIPRIHRMDGIPKQLHQCSAIHRAIRSDLPPLFRAYPHSPCPHFPYARKHQRPSSAMVSSGSGQSNGRRMVPLLVS